MNQNFEQFKKDFKQDLLICVVMNMKHGKLSEAASRMMVRRILSILNAESEASTFTKINKLSETYPAILDIFIKRGYEFDERERDAKLNEITLYLRPAYAKASAGEGGEN